MNEAVALMLAALAGAALGVIFFGGLWWTVRRGATSAQPALWFFCSLSLRMCIVLAGVYIVAGANWQRLLLCLLGFTAARLMVTRWTRTMEVRHAPQP
jgi:F1F0 ATPase subunit 2